MHVLSFVLIIRMEHGSAEFLSENSELDVWDEASQENK